MNATYHVWRKRQCKCPYLGGRLLVVLGKFQDVEGAVVEGADTEQYAITSQGQNMQLVDGFISLGSGLCLFPKIFR
jgi:hypothetical protein